MRSQTLGLDATQRLEAIPLFDDLSVAQRRMIGRLMDGVEAEPGETLVTQDEHSYQFVIIESGTAEVRQDGAVVSSLGAGDFFGEIAILGGGRPRTATVVAATPLTAMVLTAHSLNQVCEHIPLVAERITRIAEQRLTRDADAGPV